MSFKDKPLKKIVADKRITVDALHNDMVDGFKVKKREYNEKKDELIKLKKEYEETNDNKSKNQIDKLTNELNTYQGDEDVDYYFNTGLILNEYYARKNDIKPTKEISVIDIMKKTNKCEPKDDIVQKYMQKIDDTVVKKYYIHGIDICPLCQNKLIINQTDSLILCDKCGYTEKLLINTEKVSYKDPVRESSYFSYKRINHFNEWLAQFQAKETTDIPEKLYQDILKELKKINYIAIEDISYQNIREILKRLHYNKYYEHIPHIINILNGKKAPLLTREYEEQLRMMFKEIQKPFMKHCPEGRKNFLSYSYVLHKFCELIELDDLLNFFPLLKSREKLQQQDKIWKNICSELQWEYIPSI